VYPNYEYAFQLPLLLSLVPSFPPPIIQQLSVHIIMSSTCADVKYFDIVGCHSCLLSLFPKFSSVVPLSQTYFTCTWVYDNDCFCGYINLLDLSSACEGKYVAFGFMNLAYFT
jgi:hypothetical protein